MKILGICSSIRKASCNSGLLLSAKYLGAPNIPNVSMEVANIHELPLFNLDHYESFEMHDPIRLFQKQLSECDGILFAASEYPHGYTYGISSPLKNAIDWGSVIPSTQAPSRFKTSIKTPATAYFNLTKNMENLFEGKMCAIIGSGSDVPAITSKTLNLRQICDQIGLRCVLDVPNISALTNFCKTTDPLLFNMNNGTVIDNNLHLLVQESVQILFNDFQLNRSRSSEAIPHTIHKTPTDININKPDFDSALYQNNKSIPTPMPLVSDLPPPMGDTSIHLATSLHSTEADLHLEPELASIVKYIYKKMTENPQHQDQETPTTPMESLPPSESSVQPHSNIEHQIGREGTLPHYATPATLSVSTNTRDVSKPTSWGLYKSTIDSQVPIQDLPVRGNTPEIHKKYKDYSVHSSTDACTRNCTNAANRIEGTCRSQKYTISRSIHTGTSSNGFKGQLTSNPYSNSSNKTYIYPEFIPIDASLNSYNNNCYGSGDNDNTGSYVEGSEQIPTRRIKPEDNTGNRKFLEDGEITIPPIFSNAAYEMTSDEAINHVRQSELNSYNNNYPGGDGDNTNYVEGSELQQIPPAPEVRLVEESLHTNTILTKSEAGSTPGGGSQPESKSKSMAAKISAISQPEYIAQPLPPANSSLPTYVPPLKLPAQAAQNQVPNQTHTVAFPKPTHQPHMRAEQEYSNPRQEQARNSIDNEENEEMGIPYADSISNYNIYRLIPHQDTVQQSQCQLTPDKMPVVGIDKGNK